MDPQNLIFAFFLAIITMMGGFPIIFAAPGAVVIYPITRTGRPASQGQSGRIAIAGALANLTFAAFFALLMAMSFGTIAQIASIGLWINGFLAFFNLLPFGMLDGKKVLNWDRRVWAFSILLAITALTLA